ncbi:MAG: PIN domain-containing protein [Thermoleophilia bacterium]|nr:PIN domain-containing protein [Thermoleophilia bacterium]
MAEPGGVVLDSSAVLALLLEEPGAAHVEALLRAGDPRMASVNAAEVVDVMVRVYRGEPDAVVSRVADLLSSTVRAVETSFELSARAGELRARLFDRRARRLSMADCYVLALAEPRGSVATTDAVLRDAAEALGLQVVPLG